MPMKWTPENDQVLFLKILETCDVAVDAKAVSESWRKSPLLESYRSTNQAAADEEKPTPRAIQEHLSKLRQNAKSKGQTGHFSVSKVPRKKDSASTSKNADSVPAVNDPKPTPKKSNAKPKSDTKQAAPKKSAKGAKPAKATSGGKRKAESDDESDFEDDKYAGNKKVKREEDEMTAYHAKVEDEEFEDGNYHFDSKDEVYA
ncbi:hypothetical protein ACLMJK_002185 [Lecanora helva]